MHMLALQAILALNLPSVSMPMTRRNIGTLGLTAALTTLPANAYDSISSEQADFEAMEKLRKERAARLEKNNNEIKPYLVSLSGSKDVETYAKEADKLSLYIIGKGELPEGINPGQVRDVIQDTYEALPKKGYLCEPTRSNNGVCFAPGPPADDAYKACINELRKYSTKKFKGSLQSDGVSAANSAAF